MNEVSVPRHYDGPHIWTGIILEGAAEMMIKGYAMGNNWPGFYTTSLQEAFARGWRSREDYVDAALNMQQNTCPFDVTGHPALTIPCGMVDGLPIGMMLVGKHFDEATLIRAASAFETLGDWRSR